MTRAKSAKTFVNGSTVRPGGAAHHAVLVVLTEGLYCSDDRHSSRLVHRQDVTVVIHKNSERYCAKEASLILGAMLEVYQ